MTMIGILFVLCWSSSLLSFRASAFPGDAVRGCEKPPADHFGVSVAADVRLKFFHGEKLSCFCVEQPAWRRRGTCVIQCLDGTWSKPTLTRQCKPSCKEPKTRFQHKYTVVSGVRSFYAPGDTLDFHCLEPYVLNGSASSTCGVDGKWASLPKCTRVCDRPVSTNPNAYHVDNRTHFAAEDRVSYTCAPGYSHTGGKIYQTCTRKSWTWSPLEIQCERVVLAVCDRPVSTYPNAYLEDTRTHFAAGDRVSYTCAIGYSHSRGSRYRTCTPGDRSWTPLEIQCERKSCGSAGEISNGAFVYEGSQFGDVVRAVCTEGHIMVGKATRNCMNGGWDGRAPVCEVVRCEKPETNAEVIGAWRQSYEYRHVVSYRCRKGTLVGSAVLWCTENGTWSAPSPSCTDAVCPFPRVQDASMSGARVPPFKPRATVTFRCRPGYRLTGSDTVSCDLEGRWTPPLPQCLSNWRGK